MYPIIVDKQSVQEVYIKGDRQHIIPFVCANREIKYVTLGIGYTILNGGEFLTWGLVAPHNLIQSWRSMKLLSHIKHIECKTLYYCYDACRIDNDSDINSRDMLAEQFESREEFDNIISQIMDSVPHPDKLSEMINILSKNNIDIDGQELQGEINAGRIEITNQIQDILDAESEKEILYRHKLNLRQKAESIAYFFKDLNLDNFIIGGGCGIYGLDWGHIDLKELDRIIRLNSAKDWYQLKRTTMTPKMRPVGFGIYKMSFGNIEQPYYVLDDRKYVFVSAKWANEFYVKTIVWHKYDNCQPMPVTFTISQLRKIFGIVVS